MTSAGRLARLERAVSLTVGTAAVVAALVALYQAALAREQARASAWPFLEQGNSLAAGRPYVRTLANKGVGPARIRDVRVEVDGRPVPTWPAAIAALAGAPDARGTPDYDYTRVGPGSVQAPGAVDTLLVLPPGPVAAAFLPAAAARLSVVVCYCSVYDECWVTADRVADPRPVAACRSSGPAAFRQ